MAHLRVVTAEDIEQMEKEELEFMVKYLSKLQANLTNELRKLGLSFKIDANANVTFDKGRQ